VLLCVWADPQNRVLSKRLDTGYKGCRNRSQRRRNGTRKRKKEMMRLKKLETEKEKIINQRKK
jgi:hypothetical protein